MPDTESKEVETMPEKIQNNEIFAGFWIRVISFFVDFLLITIFWFVCVVILSFFFKFDSQGNVAGNDKTFETIAMLLFFLIYWIYHAIFESSTEQATAGKLVFRIKVTDLQGNRISFLRATFRCWLKGISALPFGIGFLLPVFTRRKQALHDIISGCLLYQKHKGGEKRVKKEITSIDHKDEKEKGAVKAPEEEKAIVDKEVSVHEKDDKSISYKERIKNYSDEDLLDSLKNINKEEFPDRYSILLNTLKERGIKVKEEEEKPRLVKEDKKENIETPESHRGFGLFKPNIFKLIAKGDKSTLRRLLFEDTSSINSRDNKTKFTPLQSAIDRGYSEIVEMLIHAGADVNAPVDFRLTQTGDAISIEPYNTTCMALKASPLHLAIDRGHKNIVELLIKSGADVNSKTTFGYTPLHLAVDRDFIDDSTAMVKLITDAKAELNGRSGDKRTPTPLHRAVANGHLDVVKILIKAGAEINTTAIMKITPLITAVGLGYVDIIKVLLENGVDVSMKSSEGNSAYEFIYAGTYSENKYEIIGKINDLLTQYIPIKIFHTEHNHAKATKIAEELKSLGVKNIIYKQTNSIDESYTFYACNSCTTPGSKYLLKLEELTKNSLQFSSYSGKKDFGILVYTE